MDRTGKEFAMQPTGRDKRGEIETSRHGANSEGRFYASWRGR